MVWKPGLWRVAAARIAWISSAVVLPLHGSSPTLNLPDWRPAGAGAHQLLMNTQPVTMTGLMRELQTNSCFRAPSSLCTRVRGLDVPPGPGPVTGCLRMTMPATTDRTRTWPSSGSCQGHGAGGTQRGAAHFKRCTHTAQTRVGQTRMGHRHAGFKDELRVKTNATFHGRISLLLYPLP